MAGIMYDKELDEDIRSLRQTILYGLKGISAYGHQARELGYYSTQVDDFYIYGLEALTDDALTVEELIRMTMRTGEMALEVMKQLDEANTSVYGNPYPHKVSVRRKKDRLSSYRDMTLKIWKCCWNRPKAQVLIFIPMGKCCRVTAMKD